MAAVTDSLKGRHVTRVADWRGAPPPPRPLTRDDLLEAVALMALAIS
jgi:hypothetical protein